VADELPLTAAEEPERQAPDISPEAGNAWEKRLQKRGLADPATAEEPAARQAPRQSGATQGSPALPPARGHRERQERRQDAVRQREEFQAMRQELADLKALLAPEKALDPDANPAEYTSDLVKKAVIAALGGDEVVSYLRESHQERQTRLQQDQEIRRENAFLGEWGGEMTGWESEYRAQYPEQAKGYEERLAAFMEVCVRRSLDLGDPPAVAEREAVRGLIALTDQALQRGIHPVAYVDHLFRQSPVVEQRAANAGRARQAAENRETRERRAAGAAASTFSTTKAPPAASPQGKLAAAIEDAPVGRGRAAAMVKAARAQGGGARAALKQMRSGG